MASHWGYGEHDGPEKWSKFCPVIESPKHGQSPIDIDTKHTQKAVSDDKLHFRYDRSVCTKLKNNGHTFVVEVDPQEVLDPQTDYSLRGGPLQEDRYRLCQIHYHWGRNNTEGSEHTVNGQQYVAEAHLVHFNMKYSSFAEAFDKYDGLAVVGILYEVGDDNNNIQRLVDKFDEISYKGDCIDLKTPFNAKWLIPKQSRDQAVWYYHGSLTTPPCTESVNWIVFQKLQSISKNQLEAFRSLHSFCPRCSCPGSDDEHDGKISHNFRPTQPKDFRIAAEVDGKEDEIVERPLLDYPGYLRRNKQKKFKANENGTKTSMSSSSDEDSDEE